MIYVFSGAGRINQADTTTFSTISLNPCALNPLLSHLLEPA